MNFREMTKEQLTEESFIDLAYAILVSKKQPLSFPELMSEIQAINGCTDAEMKERLLQFYTDLNIEGRFIVLGENRWGLREWYAIEQIEEETAPTVKVRKKKTKAAVAGEDDSEEDEDLEFEENFDEFVEDPNAEEEEEFEDVTIDDIDEDIDEDLLEEEDEFEIVDEEEEEEEEEEE
ncbi:DNA-directed RNA polymerase subunit delta [Viridibacillus sp. YIM B01967]|uniref:Probable DNA-directed RNA polymerase subunit delta n=1 Tax=Viridibacillus soli TaxID=2798301 RepID=A0ABS1H8B5_9BACL|nr:DNA-directed RNA polymerase subunit delta [Viridibacillus soli]MBK3495660.1 DNA-directed RNA polymerase subunit delta [Viridibacillus soli]